MVWYILAGETMHTFTILTTRVATRLEWLHGQNPYSLRPCAVFLLCFSNITSTQQSKSHFVIEVFCSTVSGEK